MLDDIVSWAWARHHNVLSWYVRPLFLVPFCYFAYKRRWKGIVLTMIALITSMFWFPAPKQVDPGIVSFLEAERAYLSGPWTVWKVLISLLVPVALGALGVAFWKRSLGWGIAVINAIALTKVTWSFVHAPAGGAVRIVAPALTGLIVCNLFAVWLARRGRVQI